MCADRYRRAVGPQIIHSRCPPAVQPNAGYQGPQSNFQIGPAADRPQIGIGRAVTPAAMLRCLHGPTPSIVAPAKSALDGMPGPGRLDEEVRERVPGAKIGHPQRPFAATKIVGTALIRLLPMK